MNTVALRESEGGGGGEGCKVGRAIRGSNGEKTKDFYQRDWEAGQSREVSGGAHGMKQKKKKKHQKTAAFVRRMPRTKQELETE